MRLAVGHIVELVGPNRAIGFGLRQSFGQSARIAHVVVGVLIGRGGHLHEFCARQPQHVFLFLALGFGNDDHRLEPHRGPDQRQTNPGVARRAFDNGAAGAQKPLGHRIADHEQGRAVLDRLAGV